MPHSALPAAALASLLVAPATAQTLPTSVWPMYQYAADHEAMFRSPAWAAHWAHRLKGRVNGGLSIVGTTLYVESFDKRLTALDAQTGRELWEAALPNIAMNTPIVADQRVFVGTGDSDVLSDETDRYVMGRAEGDSVIAFDTTRGTQLWRYDTVGEDMPTPVYVVDGTRHELIFSNGDDAVRALDAASGKVLWQAPMIGAATMSSLAVYGGMVYGLSLLGFHYVLATYHNPYKLRYQRHSWAIRPDGQYVWQTPYGNADCSPTVADGTVFVEDDERRALSVDDKLGYSEIFALDAHTGAVRWKYTDAVGPWSPDGSKETSIAGLYAHGRFYESLPFTRRFVAFEGRSGHIAWSFSTQAPVKMSAVERDGKLYFGDTAGWFYVVDAGSGKQLQAAHFPQIFTASPPVIVGATLFVADDKTVLALPIADDGTVSAP
ncbi:MAG TPA: PQQ-binding-like beta-propeller repeat protein [Candidatus Acidoferrum sp.]|nr:PQQ-binding-like beta-propeller repeat protein [Candidatus Acidoferrum sp.]